jgi:hypothetical protein
MVSKAGGTPPSMLTPSSKPFWATLRRAAGQSSLDRRKHSEEPNGKNFPGMRNGPRTYRKSGDPE